MNSIDGKSGMGGDLMRKRVLREAPPLPQEVRVKMRRNQEEAVERGSISSLSLVWPKDKSN